jgi:hypothetical protein
VGRGGGGVSTPFRKARRDRPRFNRHSFFGDDQPCPAKPCAPDSCLYPLKIFRFQVQNSRLWLFWSCLPRQVPAHNETYPKCGTEMRIISFIIDKAVMQKILTHLEFLSRTAISGRRRHPRNARASHPRLSLMKMRGPALMNRCADGKKSGDRYLIGAPIIGGKWV